MSLAEVKLQGREFLATWCSTNLVESPTPAPKELASMDVPAGNLEGETYWELATLTGGPELSSQVSIRRDFGRL